MLQHHLGTGDSRLWEVAHRVQRCEVREDGEGGAGDVDGGGAKLAARACCRNKNLQLLEQCVQLLLLPLECFRFFFGDWRRLQLDEVVRVDDEALAISRIVVGLGRRLHEHHSLDLLEVGTLGDELGLDDAFCFLHFPGGCSSFPDLDATQEEHRDGGGHLASRVEVDDLAVGEVGATRQVLGFRLASRPDTWSEGSLHLLVANPWRDEHQVVGHQHIRNEVVLVLLVGFLGGGWR